MKMSSRINRRALIVGIGGATLSGVLTSAGVCHSQTDTLRSQVQSLPETTPQQKRKKATLLWALEDSDAATTASLTADTPTAARLTAQAQATRADVQALLSQNIGAARNAPANLFPTLPQAATNPVITDSVKAGRSVVTTNTVYGKIPGQGNAPTDTSPSEINNRLAPRGLLLTQLLCHPQSPLAGDATLILTMFRHFEVIYQILYPPQTITGNFGFSAGMTEMYLLLRTVYPDLILPSKKLAWETALRANANVIANRSRAGFAACVPGTAYPNAEIKWIEALVYSAQLFPDTDFAQVAANGLKLQETALLPDGGFNYIESQNEVYVYHQINVYSAARIYQVSGDALALRLVRGSGWYNPLSIEAPGVAEYATASSWKHYWNAIHGATESMIVAALTDDPRVAAHNMRVALFSKPLANLTVASFYVSPTDVPPAAQPDDFFLYDRNVQGPRSRLGLFSTSGTSRTLLLNDKRGKSTFVGCMLLNPQTGSNIWTLNAALDGAGMEIRLGGRDLDSFLNDINSTTVSKQFAVICSQHEITSYKHRTQDPEWDGEQIWFMSKHRLIGIVVAKTAVTQRALNVTGLVTLTSGRGSWGTRKTFDKIVYAPGETASYGALCAKIHAHNYAGGVQTGYTDVFDPNAGTLKTGLLRLRDATADNATQLTTYAPGTEFFYVAEIFPESVTPAISVLRLTSRLDAGLVAGLVGLEVNENGIVYRIVRNMSANTIVYNATRLPTSSITLHQSGEQYRPDWIGASGTEEWTGKPKTVRATGGLLRLTIPAGQHIVLTYPKKQA